MFMIELIYFILFESVFDMEPNTSGKYAVKISKASFEWTRAAPKKVLFIYYLFFSKQIFFFKKNINQKFEGVKSCQQR